MIQKVKSWAAAVCCCLSVFMMCSEPADGSSMWFWAVWELGFLALGWLSGRYLCRHLPGGEEGA